MTAFLIVIIVLQSLAVIAFAIKWTNTHIRYKNVIKGDVRMIEDLHETVVRWRNSYAALETGMDEMQEGYQQEILTLDETIDSFKMFVEIMQQDIVALKEENNVLEAYLEHHDRECLPILSSLRWRALDGAVENA